MTGEMKVFVAVSNLSTLVGYNKRSTYIFFSQMQRNIDQTPLLAVLLLKSSNVAINWMHVMQTWHPKVETLDSKYITLGSKIQVWIQCLCVIVLFTFNENLSCKRFSEIWTEFLYRIILVYTFYKRMHWNMQRLEICNIAMDVTMAHKHWIQTCLFDSYVVNFGSNVSFSRSKDSTRFVQL